jgi:serine/threonine protein phosphatase PrpC
VSRVLSRHITSYGLTDIGLSRPHNEDAWNRDLSHHLYIVADGIGGRQAGEVASQFATQKLCQIFTEKFEQASLAIVQSWISVLKESVELVNDELFAIAEQNEFLKGMGTTLCTLLLSDEYAILAHLGDSRIYRLRDQTLECLTQDHSHEPRGNSTRCLSKALGTRLNMHPTLSSHEIDSNDLFLLCSDGLTAFVLESQIQTILAQPSPLKEKAQQLIKLAKESGGHDNITVLLVQVDA